MNKTPNFININLRFLTDDLLFEEKLVTKRTNGNIFHHFDIMITVADLGYMKPAK